MKEKKKKYNPISLNWGETNKIKVSQQNSMSDYRNPYEHLNEAGNEKKTEESGEFFVAKRGAENHAPQKDLQLGKRSITQKRIAEKLAQLVQANGIEFYIKEDNENETLANLELEEVNSWLEKGLQESIDVVSNGIVYQNLSSIVVSQKAAFVERNSRVIPTVLGFSAYPSEWLRFSQRKMDSNARFINEYHFYNETWGFKGLNSKGKTAIPEIIPLKDYIRELNKDPVEATKKAFAIKNIEADRSEKESFVSLAVSMRENIFDNSYPLPYWKANSSINDIQAEFESSCIRIDYLRNGLHIFAIVNIYSTTYNTTTESADETVDETWAEDLAVVQALKGSYNSGRVIVNPLGTDDPNLDGKIVIEKLELSFPTEQVKYFNEEARAAILTAWGVQADLFAITKPEKSNLRSQAEFLKIGILQLNELIRMYQNPIEKAVEKLLKYYGIETIGARMTKPDSSLFLVILAEIAKDYLTVNEFRALILGIQALEDDELAEILGRNSTSNSTSNSQIQNQDE